MADEFKTTRWSVVLSARRGKGDAREALEWLCQTYWYPLFAYVRRQGHSADQAQDLTQGFFLRVLEPDFLRSVDPELGRFRAFLLASIKHFLSNQRERERALTRRADDRAFQVDLDDAECRYALETNTALSPDALFEARWARFVLDRAIRRLAQEYELAAKGGLFRGLRGHLTGDEPPYERMAGELGTTEGALRVAVHRLRRRLGTLLREEVAQTVARPEDVDIELRSLLEAAGRQA